MADAEADLRLAEKIRGGVSDAEVQAFTRRLARMAMSYAMARFGHSRTSAEDFVGDFWLLLVENGLKTYDASKDSLAAYCFTMFRNHFFREGQKAAKRERLQVPIDGIGPDGERRERDLPSSAPSPEKMLILEEERAALEGLLNRLDPEAAKLIVDSYVEDIPREESARALDIKPGTARQRLRRASAELREEWRRWQREKGRVRA